MFWEFSLYRARNLAIVSTTVVSEILIKNVHELATSRPHFVFISSIHNFLSTGTSCLEKWIFSCVGHHGWKICNLSQWNSQKFDACMPVKFVVLRGVCFGFSISRTKKHSDTALFLWLSTVHGAWWILFWLCPHNYNVYPARVLACYVSQRYCQRDWEPVDFLAFTNRLYHFVFSTYLSPWRQEMSWWKNEVFRDLALTIRILWEINMESMESRSSCTYLHLNLSLCTSNVGRLNQLAATKGYFGVRKQQWSNDRALRNAWWL